MLRITMNKSAAGAKKYYSEEYYSEGRPLALDYYSEKDQAIGKWGGAAAEKLGLKDDISKGDFAMLCDNVNPEIGKKLTGRNDKDRTVGYDFTFNASKSVSLAYTFGDEEQKKEILNAFRDSVNETMREVEGGMQARVRGNGKNENRETGNIIYGEFVHFTTRPIDGVPDPHLHSHCFVFNATYDEKEDKWKAGQFRQVKQDAPYYEAYFHSTMAAKLEEQGYEIEKTLNGFEIGGIEKGTIEKYSRRTKEIEEHAKANNITDDKQKANIGARTREAKRSNVDGNKELEEWQSRLSEDERKRLEGLKRSEFVEGVEKDRIAEAGKALEYSLQHNLERKSVVSDKEILTTAIKASIGKASPEQLKSAFAGNSEILSVKEDNRTLVTTKAALNEEKQLIVNAIAMKGKFRPISEEHEFRNESLNEQQKAAVMHGLNTTDGMVIISGKAGTGKTTLMKELKHGIEDSGRKIFAFAPSSEASRVVQKSEGFENADTIAALIQKKEWHEELKGQVIWIDEAGMVSNRDMNRVLGIAKEQNARVILSGDVRQHNSVERGDALRLLQKDGGIASITVDKIQRQKNADYRQAVKYLSEAKIEKGFKKLEAIGAVKEVTDHDERIKLIAEDYFQSTHTGADKRNVLVVSPTHAEGGKVTRAIREKLKEQGLVSDNGNEFVSLKNMQFTQAEKGNAGNYEAGQVIAFHQNAKGIKAGSRLTVKAANDNGVTAVDDKGIERQVDLSMAARFSVFEAKPVEISKGDKIRITANGKAMDGKHLFNGTAYDVEGFDRLGNVKLSNGSVLSKDYGHFNYGYVMTSHSAQGKTTDKIIISQSSATMKAASMEQFYVSVSRGRMNAAIYTDDKEALLEAVNNSVQRLSAGELLERIRMADEHSRVNMLVRMKDKVIDSFTRFTQNKTRYDGLQGKDRA